MLQLHQLNERGIMNNKKQPHRYTIDLDPELRAALERLAKTEHVPLSVIVRKALREYIFLSDRSTDATNANSDQGELLGGEQF